MLLALIGALLIGVSLGLLGSGGSILTVPVLIFLADRPEKAAIAESLAIVGSVALAGAIPFALRRRVHWPSVLLFGGPGMVGAWLGAWFGAWIPSGVQLSLFAVVMILAAVSMLRPSGLQEKAEPPEPPGRSPWTGSWSAR